LLGIAATTGLSSTSESPEATENITVPVTIHKNAASGNTIGRIAYIISPTNTMSGVALTVLCMLKCAEKKVNTKSIMSCAEKLITTRNPSKEYERLYISLNVRNKSGDKLADTAIVTPVR
jgi:hypothetical protein